MANNLKCYLCGHGEFERVEGKVRDIPEMAILMCKNCGLVFLESLDHISSSFYEESKMLTVNPAADPVLIWQDYLSKCLVDDRRRAAWLKEVIKNKSVLDFGCGAGGMLLCIRDLVSKCEGVEKDNRFREILRKKENLKIYADLNEIEGAYDVITLFHVLEHLANPREVLAALSKFLNHAGSIIIEVPNVDDALLSLYKSKAFSEFTFWGPHLYMYNNSTLARLFGSAGFKINFIRQIQRYSLSNHLFWLSQGKPGGHMLWDFMNDPDLNQAYEKKLAELEKCDTIIASISKKDGGGT